MSPHRVGLLLVNLGSPEQPRETDVRRFLAQFLGDPDVVQANRALWWLVLHGLILPRRSRAAAALYQRIWSDRGSPLVVNGRALRDVLAEELGSRCEVRLAMRYGSPSIEAATDELCGVGCESLAVLPLFPQFSESTSGSIAKSVLRAVRRASTAAPALRFLPPYFADAGYVDACARRVRETPDALGADHFVISFHGLPRSYVERGDPYASQCDRTARALARALEWPAERWSLAFQSRFGRGEWLEPYVDDRVRELATRCARVTVVAPGFASDCLETLEELNLRLRDTFLAAGGRELVVVPALNDHPAWVRAVVGMLDSELATLGASRSAARAGG